MIPRLKLSIVLLLSSVFPHERYGKTRTPVWYGVPSNFQYRSVCLPPQMGPVPHDLLNGRVPPHVAKSARLLGIERLTRL